MDHLADIGLVRLTKQTDHSLVLAMWQVDHGQVLVDHDHGLVFLFGQTSGGDVNAMAVDGQVGSTAIERKQRLQMVKTESIYKNDQKIIKIIHGYRFT